MVYTTFEIEAQHSLAGSLAHCHRLTHPSFEINFCFLEIQLLLATNRISVQCCILGLQEEVLV
jgi:hypothetical protein